MFIDETKIIVKGGDGGDGRVSFYPGATSGPNGGDGGQGGSVYAVVNRSLSSLYSIAKKHEFKAESGTVGEAYRRHGTEGADLHIGFPPHTELFNTETEVTTNLDEVETPFLLARGGTGGYGNCRFATPTNRAPRQSNPGRPGQVREFKVLLKLIADYGLIGLPNVGKTSLLNMLTQAGAKVANYEFTTLEPNLGVYNGILIADIPGLIEGAHEGKGLGIKFLKHIEKVKTLLHCIRADAADPLRSYKIVREELASYNPELLQKPEVIIVTQIDLVSELELQKIVKQLESLQKPMVTLSLLEDDFAQKLDKEVFNLPVAA